MTGLRRGFGARGEVSVVLALAAGIALAAFGVVRGTWAVGGSDSSCYALMAQAFAGGRMQPAAALALDAPWPNAAVTFAPGGFMPSPIHPGGAAPICAPGMSLLMAPLAAAFGKDAIFWLTPLAAFVLVLSAYAIARRLAGGMAGASAAMLTATSPIVLYQSVQPMNDVLTAALWLASIALARRSAIAGVILGLAILVRPNLAPLAIVVAALPFLEHGVNRRAWGSLALLIAGAVPGVAALLVLNNALYGSAFASGYGSASTLFSTSHIDVNAAHYGRALWETQHVVPLLGMLAPFILDGAARREAFALVGFAAITGAIYVLYQPFPEWWYLRFLIPAIVALIVLASAAAVRVLSRAGVGGLIPIAAVVAGILGIRTAGDRDAFALQQMEGRYRQSAQLVMDRLPSNAVLITEWESGSIRFHAGREVVLWHSLDPAWLDRGLAWLRSRGLQPYFLFERREERLFRERFRDASDVGALDWPPRIDLDRQVRIYDPADRARYLSGENYATENARLR